MSSSHDFDFLHGEWNVAHRRRTDFLDPDSGWEEFAATSRCWSLFDGAANIDELDVPGQGWKGLTLRLFDRESEQWSLNWSSSRTGRLFPPVVGRFEDGRGVFHGDDTHGGKDVRVRFVWSGISRTTARWEQAFSSDGGETWLTNWFMDFSRAS
ncbi:hypothetical protein SLINC_6962 [Streptomyces lincolnensis]|uniref:Uncharacterized protein n=1 Tax=Streptomyces lincolnensis TaxID=1915 RepID=A0A1B1MKQ3_STRLN|nr:hypothetical protein [Streptomyces lincolnensis]ANS69186.1 hypothetical protein SLINC_6962 [Streptomyces lincolnensis]AXG58105.1 hypothetical protein SLCG_6950 [Streptomyces lincolnensis]QMV10767.1 hypothetical protein GJU35_37245 [Streptomyces lincolnensis]